MAGAEPQRRVEQPVLEQQPAGAPCPLRAGGQERQRARSPDRPPPATRPGPGPTRCRPARRRRRPPRRGARSPRPRPAWSPRCPAAMARPARARRAARGWAGSSARGAASRNHRSAVNRFPTQSSSRPSSMVNQWRGPASPGAVASAYRPPRRRRASSKRASSIIAHTEVEPVHERRHPGHQVALADLVLVGGLGGSERVERPPRQEVDGLAGVGQLDGDRPVARPGDRRPGLPRPGRSRPSTRAARRAGRRSRAGDRPARDPGPARRWRPWRRGPGRGRGRACGSWRRPGRSARRPTRRGSTLHRGPRGTRRSEPARRAPRPGVVRRADSAGPGRRAAASRSTVVWSFTWRASTAGAEHDLRIGGLAVVDPQ